MSIADDAAEEIERLRAERNALRQFVAALFEASGWPGGGDIDGLTFQEICAAHGVLTPQTRTAPCREGCWCDEYHGGSEGMSDGVTCYRKPEWLLETIRAMASSSPVQESGR